MASTPSPPLAEYFWIAGIDSTSYGEHLATDSKPQSRTFTEQLLEAIEAEEEEKESSMLNPNAPRRSTMRYSNGSTLNGNTPSVSPRASNIPTIFDCEEPDFAEETDSRSPTPQLYRNSSTSSNDTITERNIRRPNGEHKKGQFDFDKALLKFAAERESFLDDLSFSAGTIVTKQPVSHPKAQKIVAEEQQSSKMEKHNSLRRRISLRDLTSMRRAPSVVNRASSIRTSRRMSNYNSVIPQPQPLNPSPNMHPLKRKFEPVLLDRYPPRHLTEEANRRGPFPDYVPMFAFPNDINIVSADERPRSTWHGFTMTVGDGSYLWGICVNVWMPLNPRAAEDLERRCEEWRRDNMSEEERELAASLGERLAAERMKLSKLLAKLSTLAHNPDAREALDEEIVTVEERIGLMADLLRPVRHGAAAKIEGLTDGETGLWIPRAYGILGKDPALISFWKEWLKAVVVPMTNGAIRKVPPNSPKVGMWAPLERYVVNLCAEAPSPMSSKTQVEVAIRELRLYARKEAANELPDSRNTDIYALFRALSIQNVVALFEFTLAESRIILLSSHTSMLQIVSRALISLLYPLKWLGLYIPVLPARLLAVLDAPCPYIVGIERRYEKIELPDEEFVCVDLDSDAIISSNPPHALPKQQRRKLVQILQMAAPHHNRFGVPKGPPHYAIETFPHDLYVSEHPTIYAPSPPPGQLSKLVAANSTSFGAPAAAAPPIPPFHNAFLQQASSRGQERPGTSSTLRGGSPPSPNSPNSLGYPQGAGSVVSRNDSGFTLTATLRGKRSGNLDAASRRSSSFGFDRAPTLRRPSLPFAQNSMHSPSPSTSSLSNSTSSSDSHSVFNAYPPSVFAPSTIAPSTIMPSMLMQPVHDTATTQWIEGHCMNWRPNEMEALCHLCDEKPEDGMFNCQNCNMNVHPRCAHQVVLPCAHAFFPDQVRSAFVRCFASIFFTYRKYLLPASGDGKKAGKIYRFDMNGFLKSMPQENSLYIQMLEQTQGFSEFIHDRESKKNNDASIKLFDEIILAKKNRGKTGFFSRSKTSYLQDTSEHIWRTSSAITINSRMLDENVQPNRIPAKLDPVLMKEPRAKQGAPVMKANPKRKPITDMRSGAEPPKLTTDLGPPKLTINGL